MSTANATQQGKAHQCADQVKYRNERVTVCFTVEDRHGCTVMVFVISTAALSSALSVLTYHAIRTQHQRRKLAYLEAADQRSYLQVIDSDDAVARRTAAR